MTSAYFLNTLDIAVPSSIEGCGVGGGGRWARGGLPVWGMTMTHLYLHAGFGKAGSTALQAYWNENPTLLAEHGFHYPVTGREPWARAAMRRDAHHFLAAALGGAFCDIRFEHLRPILAREAEMCRQPNVLISSEAFGPRVSLELLSLFPSATVLLILRHPQEYRFSDYLERVRSNLYTGTFDEFVLGYRRGHSVRALIEEWQEVCMTKGIFFQPIPYRRESLFADTMAVLGLPQPDSDTIPFVNERLDIGHYEFKRATNLAANHEVGLAINVFLTEQAPHLELLPTTTALDAWLSADARALIEDEIQICNDVLGTDFQWSDPPCYDPEVAAINKERVFDRLASVTGKTISAGRLDDRIITLVRAVFNLR